MELAALIFLASFLYYGYIVLCAVIISPIIFWTLLEAVRAVLAWREKRCDIHQTA